MMTVDHLTMRVWRSKCNNSHNSRLQHPPNINRSTITNAGKGIMDMVAMVRVMVMVMKDKNFMTREIAIIPENL
jgi:pyruvate dehydrogenase complex dehydrogenase (E1) component